MGSIPAPPLTLLMVGVRGVRSAAAHSAGSVSRQMKPELREWNTRAPTAPRRCAGEARAKTWCGGRPFVDPRGRGPGSRPAPPRLVGFDRNATGRGARWYFTEVLTFVPGEVAIPPSSLDSVRELLVGQLASAPLHGRWRLPAGRRYRVTARLPTTTRAHSCVTTTCVSRMSSCARDERSASSTSTSPVPSIPCGSRCPALGCQC